VENPEAPHILGGLLLQRSDVSDAVAKLTNAVSLAPNNPLYLGNLGMALLAAGLIDDAIQVLNMSAGR
jgi:Flp pilus assembly protein TadD